MMWGHTLLQSITVVWLVQTAYSRGFGAVSGVNTQGPQFNGRQPQNGGGTPSKGVGQVMGAQNGYGGHPAKGLGYGAAAGISNTNGAKYNGNGNGASAGAQGGAAMKGYGAVSGVSNGQRGKPQGYNPVAGLGQGGQANKGNGNSAHLGAQNGYGPKHGQRAIGGPTGIYGAGLNGQAGPKAMKGYGSPPNGAGPGMGAYRGMGVPPQGSAYGGNGYGAKPIGGYRPSGGVGPGAGVGLGLGSRYGNGGMKGPKPGFGAGGANGQTKHSGTTGPNVNGAMPNGYGYGMGGANKPGKPRYGGNGYGPKQNGNNMNRVGSMGPQPGYTNGAGTGGFGGKPKGYVSAAAGTGALKGNGAKTSGQGASNGAALGGYRNKLNGFGVPGQTAGAGNAGYGMVPSGKPKSAGVLSGQGLKGGARSAAQPAGPQQSLSQGVAPGGPEPTTGLLGMLTPDQYQKLQGKGYSIEATAAPVLGPQYSLHSGPTPLPVFMGSAGKSSKASEAAAADPLAVLPQGYVTGSEVPEQSVETDIVLGMNTDESESTKSLHTKGDAASEAAAGEVSPEVQSGTVPEETEGPQAAPSGTGLKGAGASGTGGMATKGQGQAQPDCGPSGVPNGQWMKIPRPEYGAYAGPGSPHTKGHGAGAAGPSGYGSKTNGGAAAGGYPNGGAKPSQGAYAGVGQNNGYTPGVGYPYAGKPGYGQGAYLGAGYGGAGDTGKSKPGYGNGNVAGVQPDFASLQGQGVPHFQGKSSTTGLNGFQPQSAGFRPSGKVGAAYGGMSAMPFGGANPKFGIGGLQFGGSPSSGKYGPANGQQQLGLGSNANTPGKYGYGRMPYEIQTAGQRPKVKSTAKYGSAYQPQPAAMGQRGKATGQYNLGGSQVPYYAPQAFGDGDGANSAGKHGNTGGYKSQPLETSAASSDAASLPLESATGQKSYVKGETPTAAAVEGASMDRYGEYTNHVGYISGQVQPDVVSFLAASTPQPSAPYRTAAPYLPVDAAVTAFGVGGTKGVKGSVDSALVTESRVTQGQEPTDDQQQMPQQIHIQQHLKLHFHPQGGNDGKYDLNGFFGNGNSGYKS